MGKAGDIVRWLQVKRSWMHQVEDARNYFRLTKKRPSLTNEELAQVRRLWEPLGWRGRGEWHAWYKYVSGSFDPR